MNETILAALLSQQHHGAGLRPPFLVPGQQQYDGLLCLLAWIVQSQSSPISKLFIVAATNCDTATFYDRPGGHVGKQL